MNKRVYLAVYSLQLTVYTLLTVLSIIEQSKVVIYEFWNDYVKQNMEKKHVIWIQAVSLYT